MPNNRVLESKGFVEIGTGGNCTAFSLETLDGGYLLITDADDACVPQNEESPCAVGRYSADGYLEEEFFAADSREAIATLEVRNWI